MALTDAGATTVAPPWAAPRWPTALPDPAGTSGGYDPLADELVVRFAGAGHRRSVVMLINAPDDQDINVIADEDSGDVIGVQVDNLLFSVVAEHPAWRALAEPDPPTAVVADLLAEAKRRFERYGAGETAPTTR